MVNALFNLKSQTFPPFLTPFFTVLDPDPDPGEPFQYRSTWIRIRIQNTGQHRGLIWLVDLRKVDWLHLTSVIPLASEPSKN